MVCETAEADEFEVVSYLLLMRSRYNFDEYDLISGERSDLLRRSGETFQLAAAKFCSTKRCWLCRIWRSSYNW